MVGNFTFACNKVLEFSNKKVLMRNLSFGLFLLRFVGFFIILWSLCDSLVSLWFFGFFVIYNLGILLFLDFMGILLVHWVVFVLIW